MRKLIILTLLFIGNHKLSARGYYEFGTLPAIYMSTSLSPSWKLNLEIETFQQITSGIFGRSSGFGYDYVLTDLALIAAKKAGSSHTLSGGYLIRLRSSDVYHRFIQQFTIAGQYRTLQLAHRFSADQTLSRADHPEFRFRYRISTRFPLKGQTIDIREFYLKFSNEFLHAVQSKTYDLEIRVASLMGYEFNGSHKLEWGLDYRVDSFVHSSPENGFWICLNWLFGV